MGRISRDLLPVKAHYFFFFAALGPLLPQLNVFGRQLGVSPAVMGAVTAVLPLLWALAKPAVGFLVDYFQKQRKFIFMSIIFLMSGSYCCLYFLPGPPLSPTTIIVDFSQIEDTRGGQNWVDIRPLSQVCFNRDDPICLQIQEGLIAASCGWICQNEMGNSSQEVKDNQKKHNWDIYIKKDNYTLDNKMTEFYYRELNISGCDYFSMEKYNVNITIDNKNSDLSGNDSMEHSKTDKNALMTEQCVFDKGCPVFSCAILKNATIFNENITLQTNLTIAMDEEYYLYGTVTFWGFVILMCVGTVAFNVANCIGDAVCFDVLGPERSMKYGWQRVWGTAGYGITALVAGWAVDLASGDSQKKNFTPAFVLTIMFTVVDMFFCRRLKLPSMSRPEGAGGTLSTLLTRPSVLVFLLFAIVAGMFDSFIIYYMFWFLEELATETNHMGNIKLLEGLTVAAESFGGELLFFAISGKILKRFGFGHTLTFCLVCYGLRLFLISLITNPWQILGIEMVMQGPTYALCYATIVGYAAAVAPPGLSATLQGIVAGMDDGCGFALGSLLGGILYKYVGGRVAFRCFATLAFIAAVAHAVLVATVFKSYVNHLEPPEESIKTAEPTTDAAELGRLMPEIVEKKMEHDALEDIAQFVKKSAKAGVNNSDSIAIVNGKL